jgi:hypothetical protein
MPILRYYANAIRHWQHGLPPHENGVVHHHRHDQGANIS